MPVVFETIEGRVEPQQAAQEAGPAGDAPESRPDPGKVLLDRRHLERLAARLTAD